MKKVLCMILALAMLCAMMPLALAAETVTIYINGTRLDPKDAQGNATLPFEEGGTTYGPVRAVAEAFGKSVDWDEESRSVLLGERPSAALTQGEAITIYVDGVRLDPKDANGKTVAPIERGGTTYLPLRAISDALNQPIEWEGSTSTVYIGTREVTDPLDGKYFRMTLQATGQSLAVESASAENGANIVVADMQEDDSQLWGFSATGDGYYRILNKKSGKSIDIPASSKDEGKGVTQYTSNNGANQTVKAMLQADGTYLFQFRHSEMYLTAADRAVVQQSAQNPVQQAFALTYAGDTLMAQVKKSAGYLALDATMRERFESYLFAPVSFSQNVKAQAESYLTEKQYLAQDAATQETLLRDCMAFVPYNLVYIGEVPAENAATYTIVSKTKQEDYDVWRGTLSTVWIYSVEMSGDTPEQLHTFNMVSTVEDSSVVEDSIRALARFPYAMRQYLKRLIYRQDDANNYNGGGDTIWIRLNYVPSENAIAQTLAHELGHVLDTNLTSDYGLWDRAAAADVVPVSGYGNSNRAEDLAEYSRLYHMARRDAALLEWVEKIYPNRAAAYRALLYSGDRTYYAAFREDYENSISFDNDGEPIVYYTILTADGKALAVAEQSNERGAAVVTATPNGSEAQQWRLRTTGNYVTIFNRASGLCLNVPGESTDSGKGIIVWNGAKGDNELWTMTTAADGSATFAAKHSGLSLAVQDGIVVQAESNRAEKWKLVQGN